MDAGCGSDPPILRGSLESERRRRSVVCTLLDSGLETLEAVVRACERG